MKKRMLSLLLCGAMCAGLLSGCGNTSLAEVLNVYNWGEYIDTDLIDQFGQLPGIGPKSAQRMAMHVLDAEPDEVARLVDAINAVRPLDKRWEAFGWATLCIDGHNFSDLEAALTHARTIKKRPTAIIMATVKGKGLSVAEGKLSSHNMPLSPEDVAAALQELQ